MPALVPAQPLDESVTDIPGVSVAAQIGLLVYGLAPLALVCALARLALELLSDLRLRFSTENWLVSSISLAMMPALASALSLYMLAIFELVLQSHPDIISFMPKSFGPAVIAFGMAVIGNTDVLMHIPAETPLCVSLLAAAVLLHLFAEVLHYLVGAPLRRRDLARFNRAIETVGVLEPTPGTQPTRQIKRALR
jgi:hypothetical protein